MIIHNPIIISKVKNLLRPESHKTPAFCKENIAASSVDNLKVLSEKVTKHYQNKLLQLFQEPKKTYCPDKCNSIMMEVK